MGQNDFMKKRREKLRERASDKVNTVEACKLKLSETSEDLMTKIKEAKSRVEGLEREIVALDDAGENCSKLMADLDAWEDSIENNEIALNIVNDAYSAISAFLNVANSVMSTGGYKQVIRTIPEKKIPDIISYDDPHVLTNLTFIFNQLRQRMVKINYIMNKNQEARAKNKAEFNRLQKKENEAKDAAYKSKMDRIRNNVKGREAPRPVDLGEENKNERKNFS